MGGLTARQGSILILCGLVAAIDGFDTQAIGFTGPLIARDIGFAPSNLGWLFSAGLVGAAIGAFSFGPLADRYGRRTMLVLSCVMVGLFTGLTLVAETLPQVLLCRVLTGIGLGGGTPCFMGVGVETMPERLRKTVSSMLYACFPGGAIIGAVISQPLLADHGWRGVFVMGAVLPILFGLAVLVFLRGGEAPPANGDERIGVRALFADGMAARTLALWPLFMLSFSSIILLALWMPPLLQLQGLTAPQTGILVAWLNVGSVSMSLAVGWALHRFGMLRVLLPLIALGSAAWWLLAFADTSMSWAIAAATLGGAAIGGETTALIVIASTLYPAHVRATGIGWATGFSRVGQMLFPPIVGAMVAARWNPDIILGSCSLLLILAAIPLMVLSQAESRQLASHTGSKACAPAASFKRARSAPRLPSP